MTRLSHALTPDFNSAAFQDNLYRHYQQYRHDTPVFCSEEGVVYLTRYHDCVALLGDARFHRTPPAGGCNPFSEAQREQTPLEHMIGQWMLFMDPPRHDVVRKAFMQPFTAKALKELEPYIRRQAVELLDALPRQGTVELIEHYAFPLPVLVIAEVLGVPKQDLPLFQAWSIQLTQALDRGAEEDLRMGAEVAQSLKAYFAELLRTPQALPAQCLIRSLAEQPNTVLTASELLYGFALLLWAGHETTRNLIGNGIQILAERPELLSRLGQEPALMESAVEEMLRFESPLQKASRWTHAEAVLGGYRVPAGTLVTALIGAANRDPAVFEQPDSFDPARVKNRHIAFGTGIHHCLGALLARVEGRIALRELVPRLSRLEPVEHRWRCYSSFRGLDVLFAEVSLAC